MGKPVPPTGLRAVRLRLRWRIGALATEAAMAPSTIRRLETGLTKEPSDRVRRDLSRVLGVSASKLFGRWGHRGDSLRGCQKRSPPPPNFVSRPVSFVI